MNIQKVLDRLAREDEKDNGLATALIIFSDGSWYVEIESGGKAGDGESIAYLEKWAET